MFFSLSFFLSAYMKKKEGRQIMDFCVVEGRRRGERDGSEAKEGRG